MRCRNQAQVEMIKRNFLLRVSRWLHWSLLPIWIKPENVLVNVSQSRHNSEFWNYFNQIIRAWGRNIHKALSARSDRRRPTRELDWSHSLERDDPSCFKPDSEIAPSCIDTSLSSALDIFSSHPTDPDWIMTISNSTLLTVNTLASSFGSRRPES